jgi:disulfide bond formation protein DsbB
MTVLADTLTPRRLPHLIALSAALVLLIANVFEHGFGYEPCQLCLYQRLPWWIALGLGCCAAWVMRRRPTLALMIALLALITVGVGAGIAGYHAGVEYRFWEGPAGCAGGGDLAGGLAAALQAVEAGPTGPACDEVPWSLFGISMAGYNFLLSLGLVALGGWILRKSSAKP